jgi:hypothetical protein
MTNPDTTYAQLGDLQLEAVGEDELDEHYRTTPIYAAMVDGQLLTEEDERPDFARIEARLAAAADFVATFTADDEEPEDETGEDVVEVQRNWLVIWTTLLTLGAALGVIGYLELVTA